jgi:hypothetical protein
LCDAANLDKQRSKFFLEFVKDFERTLATRTRGTKGTGQMSHGDDCGMNGGTEMSTLGSSQK